jgi:hypothetical protein
MSAGSSLRCGKRHKGKLARYRPFAVTVPDGIPGVSVEAVQVEFIADNRGITVAKLRKSD